MQVIKRDIPCYEKDSFIIKPIGDIHYGTANCDSEKLEKLVKWIKDTPNVYWLGMGDYCEFIEISDKRFDPRNVPDDLRKHLDNLAIQQAIYMEELFYPIASKCLGLLEGNHEETMRLHGHVDVIAQICRRSKIPRLGYNAFINLSFHKMNSEGRRGIKIFCTHGCGGGGLVGGKINRLENLSKDFDADVYLFAHVHEKMVHSKEQITCSNSGIEIIKRKRVYCLTGTFYDTYVTGQTSYGEKKLYPPSGMGTVSIKIKPFRSIYLREANGRRYEKDLPPDIHCSDGDLE